MSTTTDWVASHGDYLDRHSALSRRLRVVQDQLRRALPARPRALVRVISMCAGRGEDLIEVLSDYRYAQLVRGRLVELDRRNVAAMSPAALEAGLELDIVRGDASEPSVYRGAVPADVVLLCGVLGNISERDAQFTIASLPQLCRTGATVIWTRSRRPPDFTPQVRDWFAEAVEIPNDTSDWTLGSFWAHPERVLDPVARSATSGFARMEPSVVDRVIESVRRDLESGAWDARHGHLRAWQSFDAGMRLFISTPAHE